MFDNNFGKSRTGFRNSFTWWKNLAKSVHICQSYYRTSSGLLFCNTVYMLQRVNSAFHTSTTNL